MDLRPRGVLGNFLPSWTGHGHALLRTFSTDTLQRTHPDRRGLSAIAGRHLADEDTQAGRPESDERQEEGHQPVRAEEPTRSVTGEQVDSSERSATSFELLYHEHADYVYNLALRLTGQRAEADDLTQDTFLRAYRYLQGYAGGSTKSWLRRITVNLFFNRCKAKGREPLTSLDTSDEVVNNQRVQRALLDESSNPSERLDELTLDERLQKALDALPPEFRAILVMRELDDLTYDQIAEVAGVPIGTVRSRLARARTMLRERLLRADR